MKTGDSNKSAAVLVFAVLLLAAGVFVLAGIAQLSATQALIGQSEWEALNRRMMLENSRAMARQFMLSKMFNSVLTNINGYRFTNELGGFVVWPPIFDENSGETYWTTRSFSTVSNTNVNLKVNPFTLMERGGFYRVVIAGRLQERPQDGADTNNGVEWNFQVRTRSPIAAGYPFVQHRSGPSNISRNPPFINMWLDEQVDGFQNMARMSVSSVTNTNVGPGLVDSNGYVGFLGVPYQIAGPVGVSNSGTPNMVVNGSEVEFQDVLDLDFDDPLIDESGKALVYEVPAELPYTNTVDGVVSAKPVTSLRLEGTDQYRLLPLQVVITNTNTSTVYLDGSNHNVGRPVYVHFVRPIDYAGTNFVVATNVTGAWRIGFTSQHGNIDIDSDLEIIGGVRSDRVISGDPILRSDPDPLGLDFVADRMMWLEDYKMLK
jgi:hypothetical protein